MSLYSKYTAEIAERKEQGDWEMLEKYSGFVFDDGAPKNTARTEYKNMM